jgi:hypothetical protein
MLGVEILRPRGQSQIVGCASRVKHVRKQAISKGCCVKIYFNCIITSKKDKKDSQPKYDGARCVGKCDDSVLKMERVGVFTPKQS